MLGFNNSLFFALSRAMHDFSLPLEVWNMTIINKFAGVDKKVNVNNGF